MSEDAKNVAFVTMLSGALIGALTEALGEMAKELGRYAGSDFDKRLDALEAKAIRSIENAPFDGISEQEQLRLIEQTRAMIRAVYKDIRTGA